MATSKLNIDYRHQQEDVEDLKIWRQLKNGYRDALSTIFEAYSQKLYNYGMHIINDDALVKDIIQDLFVTIWEKRERLGETDNILFYLMKSLKRDLIRKSGNDLKEKSRFYEHANVLRNSLYSSSRENEWIKQEDEDKIKRMIRTSINALPARQREVLFLLYYERMSFEDISAMLSINIQTVYKLNWRAIARLRSTISK